MNARLPRCAAPLLALALLAGCTGHEPIDQHPVTLQDRDPGATTPIPMPMPTPEPVSRQLPPIDRDAPAEFETATFALG